MMLCKCFYCGDTFYPDKEDEQLYEEGFIDKPDTCQECADMMNQTHEPDDFSDADNGL